MEQYKHVISLGSFCSVASEIERFGMRDSSYPFDWQLTEWSGILYCLRNEFKDILAYEDLYQSTKYHAVYKNISKGITFVHDFDKYKSLEEQLENVRGKYNRRIERFYRAIGEPTLFIRYINTDKDRTELNELEATYDDVKDLLCSFCPENRIILICNDEYQSNSLPLFRVKKDENDTVSRKPFDKCSELRKYINSIEIPNKEKNLSFLKNKQNKKNNPSHVVKKIIRKVFEREYIHDKQYNPDL